MESLLVLTFTFIIQLYARIKIFYINIIMPIKLVTNTTITSLLHLLLSTASTQTTTTIIFKFMVKFPYWGVLNMQTVYA